MRFFYADAGLDHNGSHNANSCRFITRELRARGIEPIVLAHHTVEEGLQEELGAKPYFRYNTYWLTDNDPICGWLNSFVLGSEVTAADLRALKDITANDIFYLNSAHPAQFMGLVQWLSRLAPENRPRTAMEFEGPPGVDARPGASGPIITLPDLRIEPRATFYRFAANSLRRKPLDNLHLVTFNQVSSEAYAALIGLDVGVFPVPHHATAPVRSRAGKRPVTISVIGAQRPDKGYHHMPQVVAMLLQQRRDFTFLAHNCSPHDSREAHLAMRNIASDPRVTLDERRADEFVWRDLLDTSDLIICPYDQQRYAASYSAVAAEAISYGIPLVVPEGTTLARLLEEFGMPGTVFEYDEPASICEAIEEALDNFDDIAARAVAAARQWDRTQGPKNIVDAMLDMLGMDRDTASLNAGSVMRANGTNG